MEQATKKKLLIGGALLVVAGVGGYFLYKFLKNKADKKRQEEEQKKLQQQQQQPPAPVTPAGTPPITDKPADVKAFQDWLDTNYPTWYKGGKLNKGSGYGTFGPSTQKAWGSYKTEYTTATTQKTAEQIKAERDAAFAKAQADAKKAGAPSFVFEGKAYDTQTGALYVDPSVIQIGDDVYVKSPVPANLQTSLGGLSGYTGSGLYTQFSSGGSDNGNFYSNQLVGKVTGIDNTFKSFKVFNNMKPMYAPSGAVVTDFYVPQAGVTKVKPQYVSPFDGMTVSYIQSPL